MTVLKNSFESGPSGTNITVANSGGVNGDPLYQAIVAAGATLTYDNAHAAHGALSAKFAPVSGSATVITYMPVDSTRISVRAYFYFTEQPSTQGWMLVALAANNTTRLMTMTVGGGTYQFTFYGANTTYVWQTAAAMPLNQWVRVEMFGICGTAVGNSTIKAGVYLGDSTTPVSTIYSTTTGDLGAGNQFGYVKAGQCSGNTWTVPFWIDDLFVDTAATDLPGPYVAPVTPPTTASTQQATAVVTATGAAGAAGTLAYSIAQTSGTTTAPLLVSAGKWEIPRHATSTLNYTITCTESPSGMTATSAVTVVPQTAVGGDVVRVRNAGNTAWV